MTIISKAARFNRDSKGLVHFQMKITPSFIHPQAILGVYDFLLSDEHNRRNINKYPDTSKLYNGSERDQ